MSRLILPAAVRADVLRVRASLLIHDVAPATRTGHVGVREFSPEVVKHLRHPLNVAVQEAAA